MYCFVLKCLRTLAFASLQCTWVACAFSMWFMGFQAVPVPLCIPTLGTLNFFSKYLLFCVSKTRNLNSIVKKESGNSALNVNIVTRIRLRVPDTQHVIHGQRRDKQRAPQKPLWSLFNGVWISRTIFSSLPLQEQACLLLNSSLLWQGGPAASWRA